MLNDHNVDNSCLSDKDKDKDKILVEEEEEEEEEDGKDRGLQIGK